MNKKNIRTQAFRNVMYYLSFVRPKNREWNVSLNEVLATLCTGIETSIQQMHIDYTKVITGNVSTASTTAAIELFTAYFDKNPIELTRRLLGALEYEFQDENVMTILTDERLVRCVFGDNVPAYEKNAIYSLIYLILTYATELGLVHNDEDVEKGEPNKELAKALGVSIEDGKFDYSKLSNGKCVEMLITNIEQCLENVEYCVYEDYLEYVYNNYSFDSRESLRRFSDPVFDRMLENIKNIVSASLGCVTSKSLPNDMMNVIKDAMSCDFFITPDTQMADSSGACANISYTVNQKISLRLTDICAIKGGLKAAYYNCSYTDIDLNNYFNWRLKLFCIEILINDLKSRRDIQTDYIETQQCVEKINPRNANVLIKQISPDTFIDLCVRICTDFLEIVNITQNAVFIISCQYNDEVDTANKRILNTYKKESEMLLREKDRQIAILTKAVSENKNNEANQIRAKNVLAKKDCEIVALNNKLMKMNTIIEEMQEYIDSVSEGRNTELAETSEKGNSALDNNETQPVTLLNDEQLKWLRTKRIVFVCHHEGMCNKLKNFFPNCSVSINGYGITATTAKTNDFVVFITKDIPHREFFRIKNKCISFDVPYYNANKTNMDMIAAEVYAQVTKNTTP